MFKKSNGSRPPRKGSSSFGQKAGFAKKANRPSTFSRPAGGDDRRSSTSRSSSFDRPARSEWSDRPARQERSSDFERPASRFSGEGRPARTGFSDRPARTGSSSFGRPSSRPSRPSSFSPTDSNDRRAPIERGADSDRPARTSSFDRPARSSSFDRPARSEFSARPERSFRQDREDRPASRFAGSGRPAREERSSSFDRPARSSSFDRPARSEFSERPARQERSFGSGSRPSSPRFGGQGRPERSFGSSPRPERSGSSFGSAPRPERSGRPERYAGARPFDDEDVAYEAIFDNNDDAGFRPESSKPRYGARPTRDYSRTARPTKPVYTRSAEIPKTAVAALTSELIIGAHPLIELFKAKKRKVITIYTTKPTPKAWERLEPYLPERKPQIQYVGREVLDRIAGTSDHMGVVAAVSPFQFRSKPFDPQEKKSILLLDSIQDVRNLGAILRTAYCSGIDGVVLCKGRSAPLTAAAFKASAGLAEHLDIYLAASLKSAVIDLKKAGYTMYMAVLQNGKDALSVEYKHPMCLVIGNEATGIAQDVRSQGELITLPQKSSDISYNASVAAALLMFVMGNSKSLK